MVRYLLEPGSVAGVRVCRGSLGEQDRAAGQGGEEHELSPTALGLRRRLSLEGKRRAAQRADGPTDVGVELLVLGGLRALLLAIGALVGLAQPCRRLAELLVNVLVLQQAPH